MEYKVANRTLMYWLIILIIFLPKSLHIVGMYSFRIPIILGILFTLLINQFKIKMQDLMRNPFIWGYFLYVCIRYAMAGAISTGFGLIVDSIFIMYCSIEWIKSVTDFKEFCNIFANVLNIYCILGLIECFTGFNLWATISNVSLVGIRYGLHRAYGSFENYMNNGTFLVLSLAIVMWGIQNINKKKFILTYILVLLNIFATVTRASIIGAVILQCIWLMRIGALKIIKKHFKAVFLGAIVLIIVLQIPQVKVVTKAVLDMFLAVLDSSLASEMTSSFGVNAKGIGERIDLFSWVWESIDNKWLGAGPTTVFAYEWVTPTGKIAIKESIENQYLINLFKYGFSGLFIYIAMMIAIIFNVVKVCRIENMILEVENKPKLTLSFLIISTILVYILMGFFHGYLSEFRFFFVMIGMLFGYINALRSEKLIH